MGRKGVRGPESCPRGKGQWREGPGGPDSSWACPMAAGFAPRRGGVAWPPGLGAGGPRASHLGPPGLFLHLWKGEGLGKCRMMCPLQSVIWGSLGQGVEGFCLRILAYVRER